MDFKQAIDILDEVKGKKLCQHDQHIQPERRPDFIVARVERSKQAGD